MSTVPTDQTPVLHGTQVLLRGVLESDLPRLADILATPDVARWWGRYDVDRVRREFLDQADMMVFAIEVDDLVVGSIQYYEEPAADYRHAGMDVFLAPDHHRRGLGSDAVRTLARHLIHDRGHHRLVIDPAATNEAAIRCYERVGFRKVGLMRAYERGPDGTWHDCFLLEALRGEIS